MGFCTEFRFQPSPGPYQVCDLVQVKKSFEPQFLCKGAVEVEDKIDVWAGCEDSVT